MVRSATPSLSALPDDVLVRIVQTLLADIVLTRPLPSGTAQCSHLCALSAVSHRLRRLVLSVLAQHRISLRDLSYYAHNQAFGQQRYAVKPQVVTECEFCYKIIDTLVWSAIQTYSSPRADTLYITPACHHDALSLLAVATERFRTLMSVNIGVPRAYSDHVTDGYASDNLEGNESNTEDSQSVAAALCEVIPSLSHLIHLSCQSSITRIFLFKMSSPRIAPCLRTIELMLPYAELVPALVRFLSQPERVLRLRDIRCSIQHNAPQPNQHTYTCEYSRYTNTRKRSSHTIGESQKITYLSTAQLATHLLIQLTASTIAVSSVYLSRQTAIEAPDESYGCAHCALDKNADIHYPQYPSMRHQVYSANVIKPIALAEGGSGAYCYRTSFSTCLEYANVLNGVLPGQSPLECIVASRNVARIVRPRPESLLKDEDDCCRPPVIAASLRSLFRCFPPRFDQFGENEDFSKLRMLDVATTTIEKDPFSSMPNVVQILQRGGAGELDSALSAAQDTLDSIRVRPFPRAWHHAQHADKSLTLRVLHSLPNVRVFDVYICVLCSFLRQSQLAKLFVRMSNLQILHVSESPSGRKPSTTIEQPDVIAGLRTIPRLLSVLAKSCNDLRIILWHATNTCRLLCTGCGKCVMVGSLTPSFGSPLGHALHALERFNEKRPLVNTDSLQKCLGQLSVEK